MVEPTQQLWVQISSVLAFAASVVVIALIGTSLRKFSKGIVRDTIVYVSIQTAIIAISLGAMAYYHIFDTDLALDIWHVGALIALIASFLVTLKIVSVTKNFAKIGR